MQKTLGFLFIWTLLTSCGAAKNPPFLAQNFNALSLNHTQIAIVPSEKPYTAKKRRPLKRFKNWQEQKLVSGIYLQKQFFIGMARKIEHGKIDLALQSFLQTNEILKQNGISHTQVKTQDKAKLGKLLGVDAFIICEFYYEMGPVIRRGIDGQVIREALPAVTASLHDSETGDLLWRKKLNMSTYYSIDTPDRLARRAIYSIVKRLPYVQQKASINRID